VVAKECTGGEVNPRTTGLLAIVALGLGVFVYVYEIEGESARQAVLDQAKYVHTGFEAEEIDSVSLTTLDGVAARFERRDGRWEIVLPIERRADATALDAIAHALANMPREGRVDAVGSLESFGLGPTAPTIRFEVAGESKGLRLGGTTPVGGHRYVARLAEGEVGTVPSVPYVASYRINAFNRNLDDLRDRRIFDFEAGDVQTLRVEWPLEGTGSADRMEVALAKDAEGNWQIGSPLVGPADQQALRDLLSNLAYLRADGFLDEPYVGEDVGSEAAGAIPALSFHWTLEGQHVESHARILGTFEGQRVIEGPDSRAYLIAEERLEEYPRRLVDYRDKRISEFDVSAARRVEMEFADTSAGPRDAVDGARSLGGLRLIVERGSTGWSSAGRSLDSDRVSEMVRELSNLRAVDIVADEMGPAELTSLGLAPPLARLRVEGGGSSDVGKTGALADLSVGRLDPERGLFAMRSDRSTVFLLAAGAAESIPISAERYLAEFEGMSAADEGGSFDPEFDEAAGSQAEADPLEDLVLP
jgi:hypothetical protein